MPTRTASLAVILSVSLLGPVAGSAQQQTLHVYGPGGPAPAMKEAAMAFGQARGVKVDVVSGPTDSWIEKARADADLVYSGAEYMMTDLAKAMDGRVLDETVVALYMRPSAILVRPGNPKAIHDLPDLAKAGMRVIVVHGAGQTGMWEDMAAHDGDIRLVRALRKNIVAHAPNSGVARQLWIEQPDLDAWITFNIWQVANPKLADLVPVSARYVVYRDCGAALTKAGGDRPIAGQFLEFLQSPQGGAIFRKWGWKVP
jgi:accessory colonization factor AcfC